jgi:hypothetical protein
MATPKPKENGPTPAQAQAEKTARFRKAIPPVLSKALRAIRRIGDIAGRGGSTPGDLSTIENVLLKECDSLQKRLQFIRSNPTANKRMQPVLFSWGS